MALTSDEQKLLDQTIAKIAQVKKRIAELEAGEAGTGNGNTTNNMESDPSSTSLESKTLEQLRVMKADYESKLQTFRARDPRTQQDTRLIAAYEAQLRRVEDRIKQLEAGGDNPTDPKLGRNVGELTKAELESRIEYLKSKIAQLEAKGELTPTELAEKRSYESMLDDCMLRLEAINNPVTTPGAETPTATTNIEPFDYSNLAQYSLTELSEGISRLQALITDTSSTTDKKKQASSELSKLNAEISKREQASGKAVLNAKSTNNIVDLLHPAKSLLSMTLPEKEAYKASLVAAITQIKAKNPQTNADKQDIEALEGQLSGVENEIRSSTGAGSTTGSEKRDSLVPGDKGTATGTQKTNATVGGVAAQQSQGGTVNYNIKSNEEVLSLAKGHYATFESNAKDKYTMSQQGYFATLGSYIKAYDNEEQSTEPTKLRNLSKYMQRIKQILSQLQNCGGIPK